MKLERGEHSLFATFPAGPDAEACRDALKAAGFTEVQMDRVDRFGYRPDTMETRPSAIVGQESSQVKEQINPGPTNGNARILMGASTEASGMSAPDGGDAGAFMVVVLTTDDRVDEAVSIIKEHGGRV